MSGSRLTRKSDSTPDPEPDPSDLVGNDPRIRIFQYLQERDGGATIAEIYEDDRIDLKNRGNISRYLNQLQNPERIPDRVRPGDADELPPAVEYETEGDGPQAAKRWDITPEYCDETTRVVRREPQVDPSVLGQAGVVVVCGWGLVIWENYVSATPAPELLVFGLCLVMAITYVAWEWYDD